MMKEKHRRVYTLLQQAARIELDKARYDLQHLLILF